MLVAALSVGTTAVGQSEAPVDPMGASSWTGTFTGTDAEMGTDTEQAGVHEITDQVAHGTVASDDPRIAGTFTQFNHANYIEGKEEGAGPVGVYSGTARIENDEGAWAGTFTAYFGQPGAEEWYVLEGEGAYQGLTTIFRFRGSDGVFDGVIVPFAVPTTPDPVPPTTE
jgi:hypothetical protein